MISGAQTRCITKRTLVHVYIISHASEHMSKIEVTMHHIVKVLFFGWGLMQVVSLLHQGKIARLNILF